MNHVSGAAARESGAEHSEQASALRSTRPSGEPQNSVENSLEIRVCLSYSISVGRSMLTRSAPVTGPRQLTAAPHRGLWKLARKEAQMSHFFSDTFCCLAHPHLLPPNWKETSYFFKYYLEI